MKTLLKRDYSLYVVTDKKLAGNRSVAQIIKSAIAGGATIIQYREKTASTGKMIEEAKKIQLITKKAKVPLIINDRIDVAIAIGADGVHVGQDDMPASLAREIIGQKMILGVSANNIKQAIQAQKDGADYIGAGPVFPTLTKLDADPAIGLQGLEKIKRAVSIQVVAIGGINLKNAENIIKISDGIAVVSAIIGKKNPKQEAKKILKIIKISKDL